MAIKKQEKETSLKDTWEKIKNKTGINKTSKPKTSEIKKTGEKSIVLMIMK